MTYKGDLGTLPLADMTYKGDLETLPLADMTYKSDLETLPLADMTYKGCSLSSAIEWFNRSFPRQMLAGNRKFYMHNQYFSFS